MEERKKYPKTPHVHWSTGTSDDKTLSDDDHFKKMNGVVVTLKMDGENTSIYPDGMHARSLESANHPSQSWVKQLAGNIGYQIKEGYRLCGENLYAKHTIEYNDLPSYFMCFSVWKGEHALSWYESTIIAKELKIEVVPVIYNDYYNKEAIIKAFEPYKDTHEGYVIRNDKGFEYKDFDKNVAKFVNPTFRQTLKESTVHWATAPVVPNKLKSE